MTRAVVPAELRRRTGSVGLATLVGGVAQGQAVLLERDAADGE